MILTLPPNPWQSRFLDMATLVSTWSKDPSTKVGAVIVDVNNRIISVGYNGFPRGVEDTEERLSDRSVKYALTLHAEENALIFAQRNLYGCSIYVTQPPCSNCAARIAQNGISRVYTSKPSDDFISRWGNSMAIAEEALGEAGVDLVYLTY